MLHINKLPKALALAGVSVFLLCLLVPGPTAAQPFAYVANRSGNTVSVIETGTNTVVTTVPVGNGPQGVAITPDGTRVYVTNFSSNTVSVIETGTNTVVATVAVGPGPFGVAVTPDGTRAYVPNASSTTVSVINTATNGVIATVTVGSFPREVAITPDGTRAYVTVQSPTAVSVINTGTNTVVATIGVGQSFPHAIAITPDGTRAYVANLNVCTVSVINTGTNSVITTVPAVACRPVGVAVTPDGSRAYVAGDVSATVSVIETGTNTVVASVLVGSTPQSVAMTPDGTRVYVTNFSSNTVSVIEIASNMVVATVPVGNGPHGLAITPVVVAPIDIKPGSDPNSINCNNDKEVITVAILTTDDFDATMVDHTTVTFQGATETHVNKKDNTARRHEDDVDDDGDPDLVFHFRFGDTDLTCESTEGLLTGKTVDGQAIGGSDAINTVGANKARAVAEEAAVPEGYALYHNYPNPFNPSTEIGFDLPEAAHVRLVVYDVMGREVERLVDASLPAGQHRVRFEARGLPSGVYVYHIEAGTFSQTKAMTLMK